MPRPLLWILIGLAPLQMLCPSAMGASVFHDSLSEERCEVLRDTHEEILLVHQQPPDSSISRSELTLAVPPVGDFTPEVVGWHLTSVSSPEEVLIFEDPDSIPGDLASRRVTRMEPVGFVRHTRLMRLRISPHRITLAEHPGQWMITGTLVRIDLSGAEDFPSAPPDPLVRPVLERLVTNPVGVERWATGAPPLNERIEPSTWWPDPDPGRWVRLETEVAGPMRLDFGQIAQLGVAPDDLDLDRIELIHHGAPLPLWVAPTHESIFFVVPDGIEPFSATTTLWLDLRGRDDAARMDVVTTVLPTPEEEHWDPLLESVIEEDAETDAEGPIEPSARMLSDTLVRGVRGVWTWCSLDQDVPIEVPLPPLRGESGARTPNAEVCLDLVLPDGYPGRVGAVALLTPDGSSAEMVIPNRVDFEFTIRQTVSAEAVAEGTLTLTPRQTRQNRQQAEPYLDRIRLMRPVSALSAAEAGSPYHLSPPAEAEGGACVVDIPPGTLTFRIDSNGATVIAPLIVDGGRAGRIVLRGDDWRCVVGRSQALPTPSALTLWDPVDLRGPNQRADMLIITSPALVEAAERLAAHHLTTGLVARVVTTADIYDCHGEGIPSPVAIRRFLADAFQRAEGAPPAYVTLLGDCSRDHHGLWRAGVIDHVPSFNTANPNALETEWQASDLQHVLIMGNDSLADFFLGRLSVVDAETAEAVVDKVIRYATSAPMGAWRMGAGFIADNDSVGSQTFDEMCETVRTEVMSPAIIADTVYLRELPWVDNFYLPAELIQPDKNKVSVVATSRIRDMFDAGHAIVTYFGHGGPNIWADERIWFGCDSPRSDNLRLTETERLPLLINMTCSSGAIDFPGEVFNVCISEDFLRVPGGAIACYVPTGEGIPSQHQRLTAHLMDALFAQGVRGIGAATTMAGWHFVIEGRGSDLVENFVLLGDPAIQLALPSQIEERVPSPSALRAGREHTLVLDATPSSVFSGEGVAWLVDSSGRLHQERSLSLAPGDSPEELHFDLPAEATPGRWTAAVLWWDEATGTDEVIWSAWSVDEPSITLKSWCGEPRTAPLLEGDIFRLVAEVSADSAVPPEPFTLAVFDQAGSDPSIPVASLPVPQEIEGIREIAIPWVATAGLHRFTLGAVEVGAPWSGDSLDALDQHLDIAVVSPGSGARISSTPAHVEPEFRESDQSTIESVNVTVGNIGSTEAQRVHVNLMSADGLRVVADGNEIPAIAAGEIRSLNLRSVNAAPISAEEGGVLRIDWHVADGSRDTLRVPVDFAHPLADLTILDSGWSVNPQSPSEGETVFVEATVLNRGQVEARDVSVRLESSRGAPLPNRAEPAMVSVGRLLPGDERRVSLRWDPTRNAGDQQIQVVVDPNGETAELDEDNNALTIPIHVRTGEDVRFTQAVRWESPESDPPSITLTTQISNFGETDGHDHVITWYRDQEATSVIGETVIDLIPAGATQRIEFLWLMTPEDVDRQRRGETLSPTCDLGIRVGMRRVTPPEEG